MNGHSPRETGKWQCVQGEVQAVGKSVRLCRQRPGGSSQSPTQREGPERRTAQSHQGAHSIEAASNLRNPRAPRAPATCTATGSRITPSPLGSPTLARAGGSEAQRGLPRAGPEPPGGEREQPAGRLPASFPSPEPPSTHGFSLGGGPGARWRRAGRRTVNFAYRILDWR